MSSRLLRLLLTMLPLTLIGCTVAPSPANTTSKQRVILDTDANNELDDQHAIAYLLLNGQHFDVEGITVNRTRNGGGLAEHVAEAERVVRLVGAEGRVPVIPGADGAFEPIAPQVRQPQFDGHRAVDFIIERALAADDRPLVLLPVGKMTNIALALHKEPAIAAKVRVVWLGSNYPRPGEYNQVDDEPALQYILDTAVPFEIVLVRYGDPSGTDAVRVTPDEVRRRLAGQGPRVERAVTGRHGVAFHTFGDYAVNLFEHIELHGEPPSRALFDMAAVAILKNPDWARPRKIPAPRLVDRRWVERPENSRTITLWEHFDRDAIVGDLYRTLENPVVVSPVAGR
jgi:purine nucleosidase